MLKIQNSFLILANILGRLLDMLMSSNWNDTELLLIPHSSHAFSCLPNFVLIFSPALKFLSLYLLYPQHKVLVSPSPGTFLTWHFSENGFPPLAQHCPELYCPTALLRLLPFYSEIYLSLSCTRF